MIYYTPLLRMKKYTNYSRGQNIMWYLWQLYQKIKQKLKWELWGNDEKLIYTLYLVLFRC